MGLLTWKQAGRIGKHKLCTLGMRGRCGVDSGQWMVEERWIGTGMGWNHSRVGIKKGDKWI